MPKGIQAVHANGYMHNRVNDRSREPGDGCQVYRGDRALPCDEVPAPLCEVKARDSSGTTLMRLCCHCMQATEKHGRRVAILEGSLQ